MAAASKPNDEMIRSTDPAMRNSENDSVRLVTLIGFLICAGVQVNSIGTVNNIVLLTMIVLLAWFAAYRHMIPFYLFFILDLAIRGQSAMFQLRYSNVRWDDNFIMGLLEGTSLVGFVAFGLIYFELDPKRVNGDDQTSSPKSRWQVFDPFGGFLLRIPIALMLSLILYFYAQQINSQIDSRILKTQFVQGYFLCWILFLAFLLAKTLIEFRSWRNMSGEEARFFLYRQSGDELRDELVLQNKPAWSRDDHASSVGGMFFFQTIFAAVMTCAMIALARSSRWGGLQYMWPAVSSVFVFLTSAYNARTTAKTSVSSENHVICFVALVVVSCVGLYLRIPPWPWGVIFLSWCGSQALIVMRLGYLWMLDEHFSRKNNWERAMPFSWWRTGLNLIECMFGLFVFVIVTQQIINYFWNS